MTAKEINDHLAAGGAVQITTHLKSTIYEQKHAGWFTEDADGNVYVQRGRSKDQLSIGTRALVGVRFGRLVDVEQE